MRVLCLHGMGGTGATMWPLVGALSIAGHTVLAPTLPGHGGDPADLIGLGWNDWMEATLQWPADVVVGQSMGANLGLSVAARGACRAVVAINPLAADTDALDGLEWRISRGHERIEIDPSTVGEVAYEWLPLAALLAMHQGIANMDLGAVVVPTLLITSTNDDVVDPANADMVAAALGVRAHRVTLRHGGHVATLDTDRDTLCTAVVTFLASVEL